MDKDIIEPMTDDNKDFYNKGTALFGSDGRLRQVEYAKMAIMKSLPVVALKSTKGIFIVAPNSTESSNLLNENSFNRIYKITDNIAMAAVGHISDSRDLAEKMRRYVSDEIDKFGSVQDIKSTTLKMTDEIQDATQSINERPYGVTTIVAGNDDYNGDVIYKIGPSGQPSEWYATAVGRNQEDMRTSLSDNYTQDLTNEESFNLAIRTILDNLSMNQSEDLLTAVKIGESGYYRYNSSEIRQHINDDSESPGDKE